MPGTPETYVRDTTTALYAPSKPVFDTDYNSVPNEKPEAAQPLATAHHVADASSSSKQYPGVSLTSVGRSIAVRAGKALRRGNLFFLAVFIIALITFFSALAGVGYVDPEAEATGGLRVEKEADVEFRLGAPVFDNADRTKEWQMAEQRQLEEEWARKKRPNAVRAAD